MTVNATNLAINAIAIGSTPGMFNRIRVYASGLGSTPLASIAILGTRANRWPDGGVNAVDLNSFLALFENWC